MKYAALFLLFLFSALAHCQDNLDNIWHFGYSSSPNPGPDFGHSIMDFNTIPPNIYRRDGWGNFNFLEFNASICNEEGELQFYTNGLAIANKEYVWMENGGGLNPCQFNENMGGYGYILWQGGIIVPTPGTDNLYYLFHVDREYSTLELGGHSPTFIFH